MDRRHTDNYYFSEAELSTYKEKGYLIRKKVFSSEEIKELRISLNSALCTIRGLVPSGDRYFLDGKQFVDIGTTTVQFEHFKGSEDIRVVEPVSGLSVSLDALMESPRIVDPVKSILETEIISIWTNKINLKVEKRGSGFDWHQDSPYWIHDHHDVGSLPNVYLAFDDTNKKNGCLRVIESSHTKGCLPGREDGTQLGGFFTKWEEINSDAEVCIEMPLGSLVFFDPHLIHGSEPNTSSRPRRALIMTYQAGNYPMLKTGKIKEIRSLGVSGPE